MTDVKRYTAMIQNERGLWDKHQTVLAADHDRIVSALTEGGRKMQVQVDRLTAELDNRPTREQYEALDEKHNREGLERARQSIELVKIGNERDQLAERCRELESQRAMWVANATELGSKCDTLRAEVERLTALQLPPGHLPMPRRMLELLIGDPQDPYRANAESVASEMLSGALPAPESHEREFSALRNVRLLLPEIDRLRKAEERLSWMIKEGCWMHTGRKRDGEIFYYLEWPDFTANQSDAFGDPMESIDAAMEAIR